MPKQTEPISTESSEQEPGEYFELVGTLQKLAESYSDRLSLEWILKAFTLAAWGVEHEANRTARKKLTGSPGE